METFYRWLNFRGRRRHLCFLLLYSPQEEPPRCQNCRASNINGCWNFQEITHWSPSPITCRHKLCPLVEENNILSKNSLQKGRPKLLFPMTFLDLWKLPINSLQRKSPRHWHLLWEPVRPVPDSQFCCTKRMKQFIERSMYGKNAQNCSLQFFSPKP